MTDVAGTTHVELRDELAGQFDTTAMARRSPC